MNNISSILTALLIVLIFVVTGLVIAFFILKSKEKKEENIKENIEQSKKTKQVNVDKSTKTVKEYDTNSIFDFMEFESVKDNMIIQKDGKKFLMAIECQGVNYDLMSDIEKASTENGFATFLNTLKDPIQIYIQTRTINLEKNIQGYKEKVNKIKDELNLKEYRLKQYTQQEFQNEEMLKDKKIEVLRQTNLYDYGRDIIADTERMSLNKNVLKKKYYIIIKYFYEPTDADEETVLSEEEISEIAFSNLYTKAASLIRVLSGIGIVGKALTSFELVDLLYNAYNRDDSEVFGIEKAIDAGYNEIYIDAQSSIDKKIEALNKEIQLKAKETAKEALREVEEEREKELKELEDNVENIIIELAKSMLQDENNNLSKDIKEKAVKQVENKRKKGESESDNKKQAKKTDRTRRAG